ncbi:unnamed protein product [Polarella glacialis]|uniref:Uncharacterized protein n=1 Tax=Polarella glacialis TaxID=89957 RepID=A0A813LY36_POLGL|nr:unnamed protein product [Polarella glacialis]
MMNRRKNVAPQRGGEAAKEAEKVAAIRRAKEQEARNQRLHDFAAGHTALTMGSFLVRQGHYAEAALSLEACWKFWRQAFMQDRDGSENEECEEDEDQEKSRSHNDVGADRGNGFLASPTETTEPEDTKETTDIPLDRPATDTVKDGFANIIQFTAYQHDLARRLLLTLDTAESDVASEDESECVAERNSLKTPVSMKKRSSREDTEGISCTPDMKQLMHLSREICIAYVKLHRWRDLEAFVADALEAFGPPGSGLPVFTSQQAEEVWVYLLMRRGVACAFLGAEHVTRGQKYLQLILRLQPRNRLVVRGLQLLRFLASQLTASDSSCHREALASLVAS